MKSSLRPATISLVLKRSLAGCSHAIYSLRNVVDSYVKNGSTVNICALDLTKAFDKMNHRGLFIRLMQRHLPLNVLCVLEEILLF